MKNLNVNNIVIWIANHDNNKWFVIFYIGLSLILSIAISLFWLLLAVELNPLPADSFMMQIYKIS